MQIPRLSDSPLLARLSPLYFRVRRDCAPVHRMFEDSLMAGKASFNWEDPLLLDQQLTEEERMIRDSARQFAADKLAPRVLEAFRKEYTDPAIFREMGEVGLLGATIPEI